MSYTTIKPFTYAGKRYAHGDAWEPSGHRNDNAIIKARMVQASTDTAPQRSKGRRVPGSGSNG